jgi:hypothetical protein
MWAATIETAKLMLTVIVEEILAITLGVKVRIFSRGTLERREML